VQSGSVSARKPARLLRKSSRLSRSHRCRVQWLAYADNQAREVERLKALGATEVHWSKRPTDADYIILADPEGNRFCVVDASQ
jgi:predicted enzyme related to lactoylglutathione lyase